MAAAMQCVASHLGMGTIVDSRTPSRMGMERVSLSAASGDVPMIRKRANQLNGRIRIPNG